MDDILDFGRIILVVAGALSIAIFVRVFASRIGLPTAALLLIVAAVASEISDRLAGLLTFQDVQRVATLALIAILFDGGTSIGLKKFRTAAVPITILGVVGTFATAPLVAVAAHYLLGFDWTVVAPDRRRAGADRPGRDVLRPRRQGGRGPLGDDPRGRVGVQRPRRDRADDRDDRARRASRRRASPTSPGSSCRRWASGSRSAPSPGVVMLQAFRRVPLPDGSLYPLAVILGAGVVYGLAAVSHGSGFLAVFVAGIVIGDAEIPKHGSRCVTSSRRSRTSASWPSSSRSGSRSTSATSCPGSLWWEGLVLAVILGFVVRPLVVTPLLLPSRLSRGERLFVTWAGLKGAVPILLASLAVVAHTEQANQIYGIVFVVVLFSVVVQGTLVPRVAERLGVPMTDVET